EPECSREAVPNDRHDDARHHREQDQRLDEALAVAETEMRVAIRPADQLADEERDEQTKDEVVERNAVRRIRHEEACQIPVHPWLHAAETLSPSSKKICAPLPYFETDWAWMFTARTSSCIQWG